MLLTSRELSGLVHLPSKDALNKVSQIEVAKGRRPAPEFLITPKEGGIVIGENIFKGKKKSIILGHKERKEHIHIIGSTGKGKTYKEKDAQKAELIDLKPEEKKFLEFLSRLNELLPVRKVYIRLKLSVNKGNKIKNNLLETKLISETEIRLEKAFRKSKILTLTQKGYRMLNLPPPSGKGGPLHQHLQKLIAQYAETRGYAAEIEKVASNGKSTDIGIVRNGKHIAVEVSVTTRPEQVLQNIILDLEGGYDSVLVVCIDSETLKETLKLMNEKLGNDESKKVGFCLAGEVEEKL